MKVEMMMSERRLRVVIGGLLREMVEQGEGTGYEKSGSEYWELWPTSVAYQWAGVKLNDQLMYKILSRYFDSVGMDLGGGGKSNGMREGDRRDRFNVRGIYEKQLVHGLQVDKKDSKQIGKQRVGIFLRSLVKSIEEVTSDPQEYMSAVVHIVFCNFDEIVKSVGRVYQKIGSLELKGGVGEYEKKIKIYCQAISDVVKKVVAYREKQGIYFDFYKSLGNYEGYDFGDQTATRRQERQQDLESSLKSIKKHVNAGGSTAEK